jgi:hypothetical protein
MNAAPRRQPNTTDFPRQAVVVIHGIGNQKEYETVTDFARGIVPEPLAPEPENRSLNQLFAADVLRTTLHPGGGDTILRCYSAVESNNRMTDYYELYWAHLIPEAQKTGRATLGWLLKMTLGKGGLWNLPKCWRRIPKNLRVVFRLAVLLFLLAVAIACFLFQAGWSWPLAGALPTVLGSWALYATIYAILSVVGDAATYLYLSPETHPARENIRQAGVRLLQQLHEAREAGPDPEHAPCKYERIIVVGHSLGSLIGYEILQQAFVLRNPNGRVEDLLHQQPVHAGGDLPDWRALGFVTVPSGPELQEVAALGTALWRLEQGLCGTFLKSAFVYRAGFPGFDPAAMVGYREAHDRYRKAQRALFTMLARRVQAEAQADGPAEIGSTLDWRVSDLVTLGAPLTYAAFLLSPIALPSRDSLLALANEKLANRRERAHSDWPVNGWLEQQKAGGSLPSCPARGFYDDKPEPRFFIDGAPAANGRFAVLLNSGLFALTRWTNLYVPSHGRFLFGDLLSGPLGPVFGLGIADRPIDPMAYGWRWSLGKFAHTRYWSRDPRDGRGNAKGGRPPWIIILEDALDLIWKADVVDRG